MLCHYILYLFITQKFSESDKNMSEEKNCSGVVVRKGFEHNLSWCKNALLRTPSLSETSRSFLCMTAVVPGFNIWLTISSGSGEASAWVWWMRNMRPASPFALIDESLRARVNLDLHLQAPPLTKSSRLVKHQRCVYRLKLLRWSQSLLMACYIQKCHTHIYTQREVRSEQHLQALRIKLGSFPKFEKKKQNKLD